MLQSLNILYVEKEHSTREHFTEVLEFMSMNVISMSDAQEAYSLYLKSNFDILISDIDMPLVEDIGLVEKIREEDNEIQIIVTTIHTNLEYLLKAIELNLVKYLIKPFSLNDLKSVLITCVKNIDKKKKSLIKYFNEEDYYNLSERCLCVNHKIIPLDNHERMFIELLLTNANEIVSYLQIEQKVWNHNMSSAALRSLVRNLRKKLPVKTIQNISKIGYKIIVEEKNKKEINYKLNVL